MRAYYTGALKQLVAQRPGMAKTYEARKAAAKREEIAAAKRERVRAAEQAQAERVAKISARRAYAEHARDVFLDGGMDIKVKVTGKYADVLNLSYPLFSDVWTHKMEKEGLREQWRELGFRRVNLTDNYDFNVYYDLK
ncbi:hypothetical protein [Hymenobacter jejuensis]|uniref:Uncharacterized protein n=1 Tax=Hymenobacter jejuensis TaxID=2502781 RepID=A0A5B7ZWW5_9BACT|nr:hypothetical protein [Hymenobacter jejuensis]QDA59013.1 hypothetical protein FHG12_02355 [Hymenobacter jejuensis]